MGKKDINQIFPEPNTIKISIKDIPSPSSSSSSSSSSPIEQKNDQEEKQRSEINVFLGDCFQAAEMLEKEQERQKHKKKQRPVIHNFANNTRPGGPTSTFDKNGILLHQHKGANTQEDQIIRHYGKDLLLIPSMYPIIDEQTNIQNTEALLYSTCGSKPPIITMPAPIAPRSGNKKVMEKFQQTIIDRIKLMLYVAHKYDHVLITGLWGCGAFGLDPRELAKLWEYAINESYHVPKNIVFAIILDEYSKKWGTQEDLINMFSFNIKHSH
jgi:hypothetical protein